MAQQALAKPNIVLSARVRRSLEFLLNNSLLLATLILVTVFSVVIRDMNFFSFENLINILMVATLNGLIACGLTITMLAGNIDFSTQGVSAIASILVGVVFQQMGLPLLPSIVLVIAGAALAGILTGILIVNFKIPGLVATIAVNGSFVAIAMFLSSNYQINVVRPEMTAFWLTNSILGIPFTVWFMFACFVLSYIMLNHTRLGAHIYATGANLNAARLNGVPVNRVIRITLVLSAMCIGVAGVVSTARSGITILFGSSGGLLTGDAFLAVLLGGIALFGGSGKIEQIFMAILFLAVLFNGLSLLALPTGVWFAIRGLAYLLAIILGVARNRFARAARQ